MEIESLKFEDQLAAVENLLTQSLKGYHFVFDKEDIKLALGAPINGVLDFEYENKERVQEVFFKFVQKAGIEKKKFYLNSLSTTDRELVIKTYFNILENTLRKCSPLKH